MNLEEIESKLSDTEKVSRKLEPDSTERKLYMDEVENYADEFLSNVNEMKAFINKFDDDGAFNNFPFKDTPTNNKEIIEFLRQNVDQGGINPASGGHIGYIPGGGIYGSALGDYLAATMNRYSGVFYATPGAVRVENQIIDWVGSLIGYEKGFGGNLASGGSMANLIAISTARIAKNIKSKDIENCTIYLSSQTHHSVKKSLKVIGLEEAQLRFIELDDDFRMSVPDLATKIKEDKKNGLTPFLIVASAGTTDVGAIDELDEIADIADEHNVWLHVDAAYGGFFLLCDETKGLFKGINRADSVILDPHKGMFLPYGVGIVLLKKIEYMLQANSYDANYMQDTKDYRQVYSPADLSPELSRHFRGLRMWLPMKLHGIAPFRACLQEKLLLTRYFYIKVKELGYEVSHYPQLTALAFRYIPKEDNADDLNKKTLSNIHNDGRVFISSTTIEGKFYMRIAILSFRTRKYHIDVLLEQLAEGIK